MKIIEIDEQVYAYLQGKAIPYVDKTPNDTIRRLFGFDKPSEASSVISLPQRRPRKVEGRKKPKTRLTGLVDAGFLEEGQVLHVRDYRGRRISDSEATIHQGGLLKDGEVHSMSNLAKTLLKKEGYASDSVRGPAHWFTEKNESIKNLWKDYLKK
jgi:hypothetical protein